MLKKALRRALVSAPSCMLIHQIVGICISLANVDGRYSPVTPAFAARFQSPVAAVIVQLLLIGFIGAVFAACSVIFDIERWSFLKQGLIHLTITSALGIPSEKIDTLPHGDNTAVACLRYDGGALTVEYYNDASHLPEELSTFGRQTWWKNKGADAGNLRFEPLQFPRDSAFFDSCYADAWAAAHGSTAGYTARPYLRSAKEHARTPHAVVKLLSGDKVVGMIDMDPDRGRREGFGWISFFYLLPEYRGKGWAAQLLGHALWFSELHGRKSVRLHVAEDNTHARGFYEHFGFQKIGETPGIRGTLYQMEKVIGAR